MICQNLYIRNYIILYSYESFEKPLACQSSQLVAGFVLRLQCPGLPIAVGDLYLFKLP